MNLCGYYHVSWYGGGSLIARLARQRYDLLSAASAGLNLMHLSHLGDLAATGRLLDLAGQRGISIILESISAADVETLKGKPALLAHNVGDDANARPFAEVQAACAASSCLPRYLSHWPSLDTSNPALYGPAELVGVQSYVWPSEPLNMSYLMWSGARANADRAGVRVFANTQLHDIGGGSPTPEFVRAQVWLAAACGMDGVLAYALVEEKGVLARPLQAAFAAACLEIRQLVSGRAACAIAGQQLTATWPGGVQVVIDLGKPGRIVSLKRRN